MKELAKMAVIECEDGSTKFVREREIKQASYADCIDTGLNLLDLGLKRHDKGGEIYFSSSVGAFKGIIHSDVVLNMKVKKLFAVEYSDGSHFHVDLIKNYKSVTVQIEPIPEAGEPGFSWYIFSFGVDKKYVSRCTVPGNKTPYYRLERKGPEFILK